MALALLAYAIQAVVAAVGVYLALRPPREGRHRVWLIFITVLGMAGLITTALQQRSSSWTENELNARIVGLTTNVTSLKVDLAEFQKSNESLRRTIIEKDGELAKIHQGQLEISRRQLALNFTPSVDLIFVAAAKQLRVYNHGKTNIYFWGSRFGAGAKKEISVPPRLISPIATGFYYLLTDELEKRAKLKLGDDGEERVPFDLFIAGEDGRKHTIKYILWMKMEKGVLAIHTQNTGMAEEDWSKN